jgi:membrane fusion protein (multidrug efflux system)
MPVELGQRRDGRIAVLKGLEPGATVVTAGQVKLENGSKVKITADDPNQKVAAAVQ